MRLIDADKLLEPGYTDMFDVPTRFAMVSRNAIETAPTVKAITVEWIENYTRQNFPLEHREVVLGFIADMLEDWEKENEKSLVE